VFILAGIVKRIWAGVKGAIDLLPLVLMRNPILLGGNVMIISIVIAVLIISMIISYNL